MLAKKQEPPQTLAEQFQESYERTKQLAEQLVGERVEYEKACHPSLPRETLMVGITKYRQCRCEVAREVVEKDKSK
jgi:hypothetical protein